jgi:hypothetical protein
MDKKTRTARCSIVKSEEYANDTRYDKEETEKVEFSDMLFERFTLVRV